MTTDDELRELGKELPWDRPDASRREAVRSSLLVAAAEGNGARRGRPWWIAGGGFVAGAAAAAVVLVLLGRHPAEPPPSPRASIEASAQANFERELTRTATGTDEIVHLHAGKLRLSIGTLANGDHVRVRTGNAEVEGAGDVEVVVAVNAIREVTVHSGSTRILVDGQPAVFLAAGETWHAAVVTASIEPATPAPSDPLPAATPPPPASPDAAKPALPVTGPVAVAPPDHVPVRPAIAARVEPASDDRHEVIRAVTAPEPVTAGSASKPTATHHAAIEHAFQTGYALLRAGKPDDAARELAAAADLDPSDALAADARYLEATALVKAHRPAEAERALIEFLDHAGPSLRRGRASVMLARLIADRGDVKSARSWFEAALQSADPDAVAAARAGLAALP